MLAQPLVRTHLFTLRCEVLLKIHNIADNIASNIASKINDQQYCQQYFGIINNIADNVASNNAGSTISLAILSVIFNFQIFEIIDKHYNTKDWSIRHKESLRGTYTVINKL